MTCLPCDLEDAQEGIVHRDDLWACEVAEGYDVPGWFVLRARRHAEGWGALTPDEAASLGPVAQRVSTAIQQATGAVNTYLLSFGENYPHLHFLIIARPPDLPADLKGAAILSRRLEDRDREAALAVAADVRAALAAPALVHD